jgi:uncharacterized membrane protein
MTTCLFHAGAECPAASELEELDRQIDLRLKAEAENKRLKEALKEIGNDLRQNIEKLQSENQRMREALEGIAYYSGLLTKDDAYVMAYMARAAITQE